MAALPPEAQQLIATYYLGAPRRVYKARTVSSIFVGIFLVAFAGIWLICSLSIAGSPFLVLRNTDIMGSADPLFTTTFGIMGIIFLLFGLLFIGFGIWTIINAIRNRNVQAVLCEYGVAYLERDRADAFRWDQVATVLDKVDVRRSTTTNSNGFTSTSTRVSHTYTVACKDGRRFVFNNTLGQVDQLGEEMQIAVAIYQQSR